MQKTALLNVTTIVKGGGIQASVAIIRYVFQHKCTVGDLRWIFAISPIVRAELRSFGIEIRDGLDVCLDKSPAKSLSSRSFLRHYAEKNSHVVFTFFGPSYVKFTVPHLCGVADGWVTHSTGLAFSTLRTTHEKLNMFLLCCYKAFWFRTADEWVVEQVAAKNGLVRRLRLRPGNVHVVENNCSQVYWDVPTEKDVRPLRQIVTILSFAAYYPNKGLELVPEVLFCLRRDHGISNVSAVLTIPHEQYTASRIAALAKEYEVESQIDNRGSIPIKDGPSLYFQCDIAFIPSVLETFSANYPEAMRMGLPIVTSDLPFARHVCKSAASYFEPMSARDAATKIAELIQTTALRENLVTAGYRRVAQYPTVEQRYTKYVEILKSM